MRTNLYACVLAALLIVAGPARAQDSDEETKKKILQMLEKGVDAFLKLKQSSKRAWGDLSKALGERFSRKERPKPVPVPPKPLPPQEEPTKAEPQFKFDPWAAWNSFDQGAWVEQETLSKFGDMPEHKSTMKTTITSKNNKEIKGERSVSGMDMKDQLLAQKPEGGGDGGPAQKCPQCSKDHKAAETKSSTEEIEVAGRKLKCDVVEMTTYTCKDEKQMTSKVWYSKEVPGWGARFEAQMFGEFKGTSKTVVTAFENK